jgi:hypothetical protein
MPRIGKAAGLAAAPSVPAGADDEWEEVGGEMDQPAPFFTFANPGDAIEGQLCPPRKVRDKDHFVIEDLRGKRWTLPDHARLVKKLALAQIGDIVRIVYEGEETFESRTYGTVTAKLYTVKRRRPPAAQAAASPPRIVQWTPHRHADLTEEPFPDAEDDPDAGE